MIQYQMIIINFIVISYRKLTILYNVGINVLNMMIYEFIVYIGLIFYTFIVKIIR